HLARLAAELGALQREAAAGRAHDARLADLRKLEKKVAAQLKADEKRWRAERTLVDKINRIRTKLESQPSPEAANLDAGKAGLHKLYDELEKLQGESPLIPIQVDATVVGEIV